jgi:hypothetical protein
MLPVVAAPIARSEARTRTGGSAFCEFGAIRYSVAYGWIHSVNDLAALPSVLVAVERNNWPRFVTLRRDRIFKGPKGRRDGATTPIAQCLGPKGVAEAALPECIRFHELRHTGARRHLPLPLVSTRHRPPEGLSHRAAAMLSAKSSWIRAGRGHGMLGLDRSAGKPLEESDVPSHVHAQIEGNGLLQTLVSRG